MSACYLNKYNGFWMLDEILVLNQYLSPNPGLGPFATNSALSTPQ